MVEGQKVEAHVTRRGGAMIETVWVVCSPICQKYSSEVLMLFQEIRLEAAINWKIYDIIRKYGRTTIHKHRCIQ